MSLTLLPGLHRDLAFVIFHPHTSFGLTVPLFWSTRNPEFTYPFWTKRLSIPNIVNNKPLLNITKCRDKARQGPSFRDHNLKEASFLTSFFSGKVKALALTVAEIHWEAEYALTARLGLGMVEGNTVLLLCIAVWGSPSGLMLYLPSTVQLLWQGCKAHTVFMIASQSHNGHPRGALIIIRHP